MGVEFTFRCRSVDGAGVQFLVRAVGLRLDQMAPVSFHAECAPHQECACFGRHLCRDSIPLEKKEKRQYTRCLNRMHVTCTITSCTIVYNWYIVQLVTVSPVVQSILPVVQSRKTAK